MDRRRFIKNTASFISLPLLINGQALSVMAGNASASKLASNGRVLVLIQLDGGNDGLNTLIPIDQYENLLNARPEVIIPEDKIIPLTDKQGLHPSMGEIGNLYADEKLMFIQNVGYPSPNLSHFRSKEIYLSGSDSNVVETSGWFGRYLDLLHPTYPDDYPNTANPHPLAITIGSSTSPTCQGEMGNFGVPIPNTNTSYTSSSHGEDFPDTPYGFELEYVSQIMQSTEKYLEVVNQAVGNATNLSNLYPEPGENRLADKLKIVAQLIAGGLTTPIYVVNLGGFDTHANQVTGEDTTIGAHANLLNFVSEAVNAFQDDLEKLNLDENVISLAYSEFGRRIKSNKSNGTDHGEAYPMMLFGTQINSIVYGENPTIESEVENKANIPFDVDFRRVYASIMKYWFEVGETETSNILFKDFELVPILKSNVYSNDYWFKKELKIFPISPNPITSSAKIMFSSPGGKVTLKVVSTSGQTKKILLNQEVPGGNQSVNFYREGIKNGYYLVVLQNWEESTSLPILLQ